jgi:hypothetical protein
MDHTLELPDALVIGNVALGCESSCHDEEPCLDCSAIGGLNSPSCNLLVVFCRCHHSLECCIFTEIADFVNVVKICLKFPPVWVIGGEGECVVNLWNVELVDRDGTVDSCSWITVPSPAKTVSCLFRFSWGKELLAPKQEEKTYQVPPNPNPASYRVVL